MAKIPVGELKAKRSPLLETRAKNRALGKKKMSEKVEDECNLGLRRLNCAIQGIECPDDVAAEARKKKAAADKAAADKAAADKAAADKAAAEKAAAEKTLK